METLISREGFKDYISQGLLTLDNIFVGGNCSMALLVINYIGGCMVQVWVAGHCFTIIITETTKTFTKNANLRHNHYLLGLMLALIVKFWVVSAMVNLEP